ncbi:S8 family serine peptidase, partial [Phyllobacterium sp. P5_D12]
DAKKQLPYYTSYCGYTKWYCVSAPGHNTNTASFEGEGLNKKESYLNFTGTSAAAPHVLGALGLVMQRYPYLSNAQVRDVLLTTSSHMGKTSEGVPDDVYGWGLIDLKKAMSGPGQFLSRFNANLGEGVADTWVNDISQVALDQRQSDEAVEVAAWKQRKAERGWDKGFGDVERENVRIDIANQYSDAAWAAADALLVKLFKVADTGTAIDQEEAAVAADPLASIVKARFEKKYPEWRERGSWGGFAKIWYADFKKTTIGSFEKFRQDIVKEAVVAAEREFASTETRTAYLAAKTYEAGLTKSGPGTLTLGGKNTWRGDTIVDGGELAIAEGGSIISSAIVNDSGLFTVDGSSADVNVNKGGALRVGESGKTLGLFVDGGTARIDGFSDMASVNAGGVLSGTGKLGNLDMREGGHVAPGHSIGTLTVTGDATFAKGSFYDVEIAPDLDKAGELKSDLLSVDGEAELLGGIVSVSLENEKTLMSKEQVENHFLRKGVILTATKGVSGQFERVLPEYSYIIGLLDY